MLRAQARGGRETSKVCGAIGTRVRLDGVAHTADQLRLRAARLALWAATQAGAETRALRCLGQSEKLYLLRTRAARGPRGREIDSSRAHAIAKRAIHASVARSHSDQAPSPRKCLRNG